MLSANERIVGKVRSIVPAIAFAVINLATHRVAFDGNGSTAEGNATITSYVWSFGDGTSGTGATVFHNYGAAADYTVTLTVTDSLGRTGVTSQGITVP